jgi:ribA/ribD-fused uncharacterized protein
MLNKKQKEIYFYMDTGELGFLSPMYPCRVVIDDVIYNSAEHYYQSMKAVGEVDRKWIREAKTGYEAKERAHSLSDYRKVKKTDTEKVATIRKAFFAKFEQNPELAKKLIETGDAILLEDSPDDLFWGAKGENWIGKLVMEVRTAIK